MKANEVIQAKLLNQWPESWQIFEESCQYTIKYGLDFIKGVLLNRERKIEYHEESSLSEQLQNYLQELGYKNFIVQTRENFFTMKGHEAGMVFIIFLSATAIKSYMEESEKWNNWAKNGSRFDSRPKRPIYEQIRYLDIYKDERTRKNNES